MKKQAIIKSPVTNWYTRKNINECDWCFEKMNSCVAVYGFVFCSPKCAFNHKEFESQFIN
jgi:hypothetical protein